METSLIDALSIPLSACPWSVTSVTLCFVPYPPAVAIEGPEGSRWHSFAAPVRVGGPRIEAGIVAARCAVEPSGALASSIW